MAKIHRHVFENPGYWETVNRYLRRLESKNLQDVIHRLCYRLLRGWAFEGMCIRGKYWKILVDGTQFHVSRQYL